MKPKSFVTVAEGKTFHHLEAPGIRYVFSDTEAGRKTLQKIIKKLK